MGRNAAPISDDALRLTQVLRPRMEVILTGAEFVLLLVLYAIFVFSDGVPLAGLVAIGVLWAARWWLTGRPSMTTPIDFPVFGLLALLPVSLYVSTDWSLSLPKVYGMILGVAVFYAIVNSIYSIRRLKLAVAALALMSVVMALIGLVGTDWADTKLFSLSWVYEYLPRLVRDVPRSVAGGFNPNNVAGALVFFIPVLLSLLWNRQGFKTIWFASNSRWAGWGYTLTLLLCLALGSFALLLTKSRGAFIGVAFGLLILAIWQNRRFLWSIPLAALGFVAALTIWGWEKLAEQALHMDAYAGGGTLPGRLEIWQRAVYMIRDFPYTGIGIGNFDIVAQALYPFFIYANSRLTHAHNIFLEVAVDLGIPGLIFYAALLSGFGFIAWKTCQVLNRPLQALTMGLVCGMLAHQVFGLTDAFILGSKAGVVMWVFLGLAAALYTHRDPLARQISSDAPGPGEQGIHQPVGGLPSNRLSNLSLAVGVWVLFSLLAIAFVADWPYLGLSIALAGGGLLGFICSTLT